MMSHSENHAAGSSNCQVNGVQAAFAHSQLGEGEFDFVSSLIEGRSELFKEKLLGQRVSVYLGCSSRFFTAMGVRLSRSINGLSNFRNKVEGLFLGFYVGAVSVVKTDDQAFTRHLIFRVFKRHKNSSATVDLTAATMNECCGCSNTTASKRAPG